MIEGTGNKAVQSELKLIDICTRKLSAVCSYRKRNSKEKKRGSKHSLMIAYPFYYEIERVQEYIGQNYTERKGNEEITAIIEIQQI